MNTKGVKRNFVICFDHSQGDKAVLIVGETTNNGLSIVSAFEGNEAITLYEQLTKGDHHDRS